ncbi:threonine dehydratase [Candidatus Kaiserbacteria bacterium RIFCSPHIGHO2_02_FULL_59_21]|uniref:L-threonine dehydratase n=2 Tax=Candidatus Kaiseribacteriota TaxID=1752734 RepID=A0A1F6DZK7_9BACT|nr:MAG: threonine dehydratase [Candidatus Kaiserbacteria bacterium RIFCSPHIGHO2_01_FULL_58_22]OGG66861.1 MAG: threonine dehydratase [Candidatus Kaiserbacteria bacterium RIFCSPHIGHO2_02_FULL_59_21]OGG80748.1 MAG: threonine dehydratase [Candidatus Kaiserbacteria bacterium RIFCSPLOWO2_01_FULL_59_34]OGG86223.1 MAG: threonine dehydratase [Candidatus Kaiserbacteria bacterium RIFCSPLOWO2_02_FULL_59_19]
MSRTFSVKMVDEAREALRGVVKETPLQFNRGLSEKFGAKIYLKREDLQVVRSYKLRGAYNRMRHLSAAEKKRGVACASAGNHAQGVAFSCKALKVRGTIVMPRNTPRQKVDRVQALGNAWVKVELVGDSFDEAYRAARALSEKKKAVFIHPFNDPLVIAGQGTVGVEILEQTREPIDYLIVPIGGGGLIAGLGSYFRSKSPRTNVIGVEPQGAPAMHESLKAGKQVELEKIDTFVDGAAVRKVGDLTLALTKEAADTILLVPEGKVCTEMISLYQRDGIVAEPAGALAVAALDMLGKKLKGKTVVCILSGGNNDISRYPEVIERSLVHQGLKHYFIINFSQRPGALRRFLDEALGPSDDITLFEYTKKNNRESGPALVGIELTKKEDLAPLMKRMEKLGMSYELLATDSPIFRFLI